MTEKTALVTGVNGFIGRHLVRSLSDNGWKVSCLVRKNVSKDIEAKITRIFTGDITEPSTLRELNIPFDAVFHLAGSGHVSASGSRAFKAFRKVNVEGTVNLLNSLDRKNIGRFVHFSSTAAVGLIKGFPVNENTCPHPATPYQKSKLEGELEILRFFETEDFPAVILRPCMVYGPGGKGEFLKIIRLINKGMFPRLGTGRCLTPLVHVSDVVRCAILAANKGNPGETYFAAGPRSYPITEIRELILRNLNIKRPFIYMPVWVAYIAAVKLEILSLLTGKPPIVSRHNILSASSDRIFDISKARLELGYEPSVIPEEGIKETTAWLRQEGIV